MEVFLKNLLQRWEIVFILAVSLRAEKRRKVFRLGTLRLASISCQLSPVYFRSWSPTIPTTAWRSLRAHLSVKPFVLEENSCRIVRFVALASSSPLNRLLHQPNAQHYIQQCLLLPLYAENRFHPKSNVLGSCMSECSGMSTRCRLWVWLFPPLHQKQWWSL